MIWCCLPTPSKRGRAVNAMRSGDGIGPTGRVGLPWVADGSLTVSAPGNRAGVDPTRIGPGPGPGATWPATMVGRGALDTRPAQGRVGVLSRHASHLASALLLLVA